MCLMCPLYHFLCIHWLLCIGRGYQWTARFIGLFFFLLDLSYWHCDHLVLNQILPLPTRTLVFRWHSSNSLASLLNSFSLLSLLYPPFKHQSSLGTNYIFLPIAMISIIFHVPFSPKKILSSYISFLLTSRIKYRYLQASLSINDFPKPVMGS